MKTKILASILLLAVVLSSLISCNLLWGDVAEAGDVTVVVEQADGSYDVYYAFLEEVENKNEGAKGIVEHMNARKENALTLTMVDSTYGAYLSAIGGIAENGAEAMYVIVYTSVAADSYEGAPTVDYNGTTMYQAGLGLSGMSVEEGTIILFRLEKSPY